MFIRHLILLNPVQFLASFAIKTMVKRFGLHEGVFSLFNILYVNSYNLVRTVGIFPMIRFLRHLRSYIAEIPRNNPSLEALSTDIMANFINRHSPYIISTVLPQLLPFLHDCLKPTGKSKKVNFKGLLFVFDFFIAGFFTTLLKPLLRYIIKTFIGLILSAIGVIWSESLSSFGYLKDVALIIIGYVEEITDLRIPVPNFNNPFTEIDTTNNLDNINDSESDYHKTASLFTIMGLVFLGLAGIIGVIVVSDHYAHETVQNIPVLNTIADTITLPL